tara:strand:- start:178 stop:456 length:279 start_codon:yes stop_codon:yes gene_type:complete
MTWFTILKNTEMLTDELEALMEELDENRTEMDARVYEVGESVMDYAQQINSGALGRAGSALRDGNADDALNGGIDEVLETLSGIADGTGDPN